MHKRESEPGRKENEGAAADAEAQDPLGDVLDSLRASRGAVAVWNQPQTRDAL